MRVLLGSDYHQSPDLQAEALAQLGQVDVYINCGDFCSQAGRLPKAVTEGCHPKGRGELEQLRKFLTQVDAVGVPWLFIPGNHEPPAPTLLALQAAIAPAHGRIVTDTQLLRLGSWSVLAIPWTPPCGWCWTLSKDQVKALCKDYDLGAVGAIATHAPPLGVLDEEGKWYRGATPTLQPVVEALKPAYYLCGHMHYDGGKQVTVGATTYVNAARHNLILEIPEFFA